MKSDVQQLLGFIRAALYSGQKSATKERAQFAFEQLCAGLADQPATPEPREAPEIEDWSNVESGPFNAADESLVSAHRISPENQLPCRKCGASDHCARWHVEPREAPADCCGEGHTGCGVCFICRPKAASEVVKQS